MTLLLLISIGAIWVSGYMVGMAKAKQQLSMNIIENPDRIIEIIQELKKKNKEFEELENIEVEVEIEKYNNQFFVYNKKTRLFLGQGSTSESALLVVKERFPDKELKVSNATE